MPQGPFGIDPGRGGFTLEPQGMPVGDFFNQVWGPVQPFGPEHGLGPGPVANIPMYEDTWGAPQRRAMDDILPPASCPQPCPVTVRQDLCLPPRREGRAWDNPDPFGDPAYSPAGVRVVPEWEPTGVKSVPGGPALVGPGGMFIFPTPKLPDSPRGTVVPSGEVVGLPGTVTPAPNGAPANEIDMPRARFRIPWWGWVAAGLVVWRVLGK